MKRDLNALNGSDADRPCGIWFWIVRSARTNEADPAPPAHRATFANPINGPFTARAVPFEHDIHGVRRAIRFIRGDISTNSSS